MAVLGIRCVTMSVGRRGSFKTSTQKQTPTSSSKQSSDPPRQVSGLYKLDEIAPRQSQHMELIISQPADFILHLYYWSLQLKRDDIRSNGNKITRALQRCLCWLHYKLQIKCYPYWLILRPADSRTLNTDLKAIKMVRLGIQSFVCTLFPSTATFFHLSQGTGKR